MWSASIWSIWLLSSRLSSGWNLLLVWIGVVAWGGDACLLEAGFLGLCQSCEDRQSRVSKMTAFIILSALLAFSLWLDLKSCFCAIWQAKPISVSSKTARVWQVSVYFLIRCWLIVRCTLALYWSPMDLILELKSSSISGGLIELVNSLTALLIGPGICFQNLFMWFNNLAPLFVDPTKLRKSGFWDRTGLFWVLIMGLILMFWRTKVTPRSYWAIFGSSVHLVLVSFMFVLWMMSPRVGLFGVSRSLIRLQVSVLGPSSGAVGAMASQISVPWASIGASAGVHPALGGKESAQLQPMY